MLPIQAKTSKSGREYFRLGAESYLSLGRVGKKEKKIACSLLDVFVSGQVSSRRLYRLTGIKETQNLFFFYQMGVH